MGECSIREDYNRPRRAGLDFRWLRNECVGGVVWLMFPHRPGPSRVRRFGILFLQREVWTGCQISLA